MLSRNSCGGKEVEVKSSQHQPLKVDLADHADVDGGEYQLITWSKDRTLRFWPVDEDTMQVRQPFYSPSCFFFILTYDFFPARQPLPEEAGTRHSTRQRPRP